MTSPLKKESLHTHPGIRGIIFDLGGIFFNWPDREYFAAWAKDFDLTLPEFYKLLLHGPDIEAANVGTITAEEYCRRCGHRLGGDVAKVQEIIHHAFYGDFSSPALIEYTRSLHRHFRVAALTNTWSFGREMIEQRGIADLFDLIVTSAEEGIQKPDPRIFRITLERLGITASEAVFIDDTEENVEAARVMGIHGIRFSHTEQLMEELDKLLRQLNHRQG